MKIRMGLSLIAFAAILLGAASVAAQGAQPVGVPGARQAVSHADWAITLRVYDYAHVNRKAMLAAEGEATRILADAGVNARWVDCPISHADLDNYPNCRSAWQANDYALRVESNAMTALLVKSQDAVGATIDCDMGPCSTSVFYDRIRNLASGKTAPSEVLLGRVMARQIGQLFLGANYRSRTGIMQARWSDRELSMLARDEMLFAPEESRMMKTRLAGLEQAWQSQDARQTQVKVADLGNELGANPANLNTADSRR
jgi:hypothetical protein